MIAVPEMGINWKFRNIGLRRGGQHLDIEERKNGISQTAILEQSYERRMVGIGANYEEMMENIVAETGLTTAQMDVKHCLL